MSKEDRGQEEQDTATGEDRLAALEAEAAEMRDKWLRSEADLANYRKRVARDMEDQERRGRERVLAEVLSLADDLERALDAAERSESGGPIVEGVRLVHDRVREILRAHGVEVIDPMGKPFDPHEAEAVAEVDAPGQVAGTVASVLEKGYRRGPRLLRPAKVTVARGAAKD